MSDAIPFQNRTLRVGRLVGHVTQRKFVTVYRSSPFMSGFMMTVCMDGSMCMSDSAIVTFAQIVCSIESALLRCRLETLVRHMPVTGPDELIKIACGFKEKIFQGATGVVSPHLTVT